MGIFRSILVADDEPSIRHVLSLVLTEQGYEVRAVSDGEEALKELSARPYDVVISDVRMPKLDGLGLLQRALAEWPGLTFLMISAYGSQDAALQAVAAGAYDYVQKPFKPEEVVFVLKKAEERQRLVKENRRLRLARVGSSPLERIIGGSEAIKQVHQQVNKIAPSTATVLVTGESGTGKELVARALHELSPRCALPYVAIDCGGIPAGLIESELFGHRRGAFTDARTDKRGLLSEADGGTVFLDEVGELPPPAQVKLLRFLQEGEIRPVGDTRSEKVDVRIVAATLRDLPKLVEKGAFREDLFYRLNVINIHVAPLRERPGDVLLLARHFLTRFNRELNRQQAINGFSPEAETMLSHYSWPGNVRELENAIERAVLLAEEDTVRPEHLPEKLWRGRSAVAVGSQPTPGPRPETVNFSLKQAMRELEEFYIRTALRRTHGNRTRAAEMLEISQRALLYKIKEYSIDADAEGERS
jgi:two-component system response regulator AtoC